MDGLGCAPRGAPPRVRCHFSPTPGLPGALGSLCVVWKRVVTRPGDCLQALSDLRWAAAMRGPVRVLGARSLGVTAQFATQDATTIRRRRQALLQYRRHTVCDAIRYYTPYLNRIYDTVSKIRLPASVASWVPRQVKTQPIGSPVRQVQCAKPVRTSPQRPWLPQTTPPGQEIRPRI